MIRPIVHSRIVLQRPAEPAVSADAQLGQDLLDTLAAHADECVGMAANMVGVSKAVIVFHDEARGQDVLMFNPQITRKTGPYEAVEGCLSLPGQPTRAFATAPRATRGTSPRSSSTRWTTVPVC